MSSVVELITLEDLHRYVDGQLDPDRKRAVKRYIARNPAIAEEVEDYRRQNELLKEGHRVDDEARDQRLRQILREMVVRRRDG